MELLAGILAMGILGIIFFIFFIPLLIIATHIILLYFVYTDAKNRGEQAAIWVLVVLFSHFIGTIVYLIVRPKGALVLCANCHGKKLQIAKICPHCGKQEAI